MMVRNEFTFIRQVILRRTRIVIPKVLRPRVVELAHEGHQGIVKLKERLRCKVRGWELIRMRNGSAGIVTASTGYKGDDEVVSSVASCEG